MGFAAALYQVCCLVAVFVVFVAAMHPVAPKESELKKFIPMEPLRTVPKLTSSVAPTDPKFNLKSVPKLPGYADPKVPVVPMIPKLPEYDAPSVPKLPEFMKFVTPSVPKPREFVTRIPNVHPELHKFVPKVSKIYPEVPKFAPMVPAKEEPKEDPNDKAPKSFPAPMALKLIPKKPFDVTQNDGYLEGTRSLGKMTAVKSASKATPTKAGWASAARLAELAKLKASQAQNTTQSSAMSDGSTESTRSDGSTGPWSLRCPRSDCLQ